jgi:hypothetical protein
VGLLTGHGRTLGHLEQPSDGDVPKQLVADNTTFSSRRHGIGSSQVPQRLGDGGICNSGRSRQVGDADGTRRSDAQKKSEPRRIGKKSELGCLSSHRFSIGDDSDRIANAFLINDPMMAAIAWQEMHWTIVAECCPS